MVSGSVRNSVTLVVEATIGANVPAGTVIQGIIKELGQASGTTRYQVNKGEHLKLVDKYIKDAGDAGTPDPFAIIKVNGSMEVDNTRVPLSGLYVNNAGRPRIDPNNTIGLREGSSLSVDFVTTINNDANADNVRLFLVFSNESAI